jgi:hypothetical protein
VTVSASSVPNEESTTPHVSDDHDGPAPSSSRVDVAILAVFVVVATVGQLYRQRGARSWDTIWAEDGALYTTQARSKSILDAFTTEYRSYLQVLCRLVALPTRWLPLSADAKYLACGAALTVSLLAVFVYWAAGTHLAARWPRLLLIIAMVWAPTMLWESNANVANLIWPVLFAGFWAVVATSRRPIHTVARTSVALLAVLTNALALAFLPLAAFLAYRRRDRGDRWVIGALAVGGIVQIIVATTSPSTPRDSASTVKDVVGLYLGRVLNRLFFSDEYAEQLWLRFGWWWAAACLVVLIAIALWFAWLARAGNGFLAASAVVYSVLLFAAPLWLRGTASAHLTSEVFNLNGTRFDTVAALLLISAAVLALGDVRWSSDDRTRTLTAAILVVQVLVVVALGFRGSNGRSDGPRWSQQLAAARETCDANPNGFVMLGISPPPDWTVGVTCDDLGR